MGFEKNERIELTDDEWLEKNLLQRGYKPFAGKLPDAVTFDTTSTAQIEQSHAKNSRKTSKKKASKANSRANKSAMESV